MRDPKCYVCRHFQCNECAKIFRFQHTIKAHYVRAHKKYPCHFAHCFDTFVTRSVMLCHAKIHELKKYECAMCKKVFRHMSVCDRHALQPNGEANHACSMCEKKYVRSADLIQHTKQVHAHVKRKDLFACDGCDKKFKTHRQLGYHAKIHKPKEIKCLHCDELFRHYEARKRHMNKTHT